MTVASRKDQAIQLRLAGLSRSQIADALGLAGGGEPLSTWLKGVPAPAWTRRPNAKDDLRETAVAMRKEGRSYREIREIVGVSKSTLSLWLRDVPLTEDQQRALDFRAPANVTRRARARRANAAQRRVRIHNEAREQVASMSESELFVAGVVAYWAEGSKNKPWRTGTRVTFLNSDPAMITLFLQWLLLIGVERDRLQFRVHIHESADTDHAHHFWADVVGTDVDAFNRTTLKTHNPRTVRRNIGAEYHGCLCVSVRRSTDLNIQIAGWFEGLATAAGRLGAPSGVV